MYSLLCGELPFDSASEIIYQDIPSHDKLPMSKQSYNFLTKCLDKNNVTRIKLNDMLSDEWFSDY
jgi:serine/threonine protein kinase